MLPSHRRPGTRGCAPFPIILALLGYILYLHWTIASSSCSSVKPPADIKINTEKQGWANAGGPGETIYQRPLLPVPKGKMRVAVATMTTGQTTYDHISLSNKIGTSHSLPGHSCRPQAADLDTKPT